MADKYVKSGSSNTSPYDTWAKAATTLATVDGATAAGDRIYVSDTHAESTAGAVTLNWSGSVTSPNYIIGSDDSAEPPTALSATATVTSTGANAITVTSSADYASVSGIIFTSGSGANTVNLIIDGSGILIDTCKLRLGGTAGGVLDIGALKIDIVNSSFRFSAAGSGLSIGADACRFIGCSLESGGTSPTALITSASNSHLKFDGLDLTNASASINLSSATGANSSVVFRDCKLPATWSGQLHSGTPGAGTIYEMFNCDSGDTNYRYRRATQFGTMQEETTLIRTGGASDGTTGYSLKMVSNANAEYPLLTLDSPEIVKWNDTTGSAVTATIEILFDSATNLKDDEVWMEVMYLGTSGTPLALFVDDAKADVLATAADQTDSSETWTTTGMTNPNTRKLNVTFTPQERGFIHAVVKLAKASQTLYYCPKMTVA